MNTKFHIVSLFVHSSVYSNFKGFSLKHYILIVKATLQYSPENIFSYLVSQLEKLSCSVIN